jgi:hypothetical protein
MKLLSDMLLHKLIESGIFALALTLALLALTYGESWAAPCCSAGSALPSLVTNDDAAQISVMTSFSDTVMDAPSSGIPVLRSDQNADYSWLTRVSGAFKFWEDWQVGFGMNVMSRSTLASNQPFSASGLGDSDFTIAYEVLPEWYYSKWKPRGWLYLQTVLPTGKAIQDPSVQNPADVRGQGVFQSVIGLTLTKSWNQWDAFLIPEVRVIYSKSFSDSGTDLSGTWGGSLMLGAGYSFSNFRVGLRTQPVYQNTRRVFSQNNASIIPAKNVWNSGLDLSYLFGDEWLAALSYSDQTLIGDPRNTALERGGGLLISKKWAP